MRRSLRDTLHPWSSAWRHLLRYRWRPAGLLLLLGFLVGASVVGPTTVERSSAHALREAVAADHGGRPFVVQTGNPDAQRQLEQAPGVEGVTDRDEVVSAGDYEARTTVRTIADPHLHLGVLVDGRYPAAVGEATISTSLARDLDLDAGAAAILGDGTQARVVGVTSNPADADDHTVVLLGASQDASEVSSWLSESDPYDVAGLVAHFDDRSATYRSTAALSAEREASPPAGIAALAHAPLALGLLLGAILVTVLIALSPVARKDADALVAAGVATSRAWNLIRLLVVGCLALGAVLGFLFVILAANLFRDQLAGTFGQAWTSIEIPYGQLVLLLLVCVAGALLARPLVTVVGKVSRKLLSHAQLGSFAVLLLALGGGAIWVTALFASRAEPAGSFAAYAPYGLMLMIIIVPVVVARLLLARTRGFATRAVVRRFASSLWVVAAAAVVVASASASFSARVTHDAYANENRSGTLQPPGSFLVYEVPDTVGESISRLYAEQGGRQLEQYLIPDERRVQTRVTSPALVGCLRSQHLTDPNRLPASCFPQQTYAPINNLALSTSGDQVLADPGLVDEGRVGVLTFPVGEGEVSGSSTLRAQGSRLLGGNMPGLVVPSGGPEASQLGLVPGGTALVAMLDFGDLSDRAQARMRGLVTRLAPGAQTADGTSRTYYERERATATAAALGGSALTLVLCAIGGLAIAVGDRRTLRVLVDIGARARGRRRVVATVAAIPAISLVIAAVLARLTAGIASVKIAAPYGWWWLTPFLAGLLGCAVIALLLVRVPPRTGE